MHHPFEKISPHNLKISFWILFIPTLIIFLVMNLTGAVLTTSSAPSGIVSFELAGNVQKSSDILAAWNADARMNAAFGLGIDYLFMLAYSCTIGLACVWSSRILGSTKMPFHTWGSFLAWGSWLAAILDAIENLALSIQMMVQVVSPWPEIARLCAIFKFGLIFLGFVYVFYGLTGFIVHRLFWKI
jgi:hypothetical protein